MEFKTIKEALCAYDLDFDIDTVPVFTKNRNSLFNEILFKRAVIRTDTEYPLGVVGDIYTLVPLKDTLSSIQPLLDDGTISISRFYVENNGARVNCCFRLNNCYTEYGGFLLNSEFNIKLSHDGSSKGLISILARSTDGKIYPFGNEYSLSFRHTKNSTNKIKKLEALLTAVRNEWKEFEEVMQLGLTSTISDQEAKEFLEKYMDISLDSKQGQNTIEAIFKRWHDGVLPGMRNTIFGLYISVCDWAQEDKTVRITKKRLKQAGYNNISISDLRILNLLKNPKIYATWAALKVMSNG